MKPLQGITILDISRLLPGGVASLLLAEAGARVIKIEQPGVGDYYRAVAGGEGFLGTGQFQSVNQRKESVGLDLKHPAGRGIFLKLVRQADVVIENFRPGTMKRLGLDFARLRRVNRRLVLCSITGAGPTSPLAGLAGHDLNYLALSGLLSMIKGPDGRPVVPDFQIVDLAVGYEASVRILAALIRRSKNKKGDWLQLSMLQAGLDLGRFYSGPSARFGGGSPESGGLARYQIYETKDKRLVALAALEPKFWRRFCSFIGRPELAEDAERFRHIGREKTEILKTIIQGRTLEEWTRIGREHDFCLSPVLEVPEVFYPKPSRAPELGEQTEKVLRSVGLGRSQIRKLKQEGVIA